MNIEEVFCDSGVPQYTFVKPAEYNNMLVSIRTKGKGVIVEGPSGIGKTTCVKKCLLELEKEGIEKPMYISSREKEANSYVQMILDSPNDKWGTIILDDFHLFDPETQRGVSDLLKLCADERNSNVKLILIGINNAGQNLVNVTPDLFGRIDVIHFESNPSDKIQEMVMKGEQALNVTFLDKESIIKNSYGSFHIAQMLCASLCITSGVMATCEQNKNISVNILDVIQLKVRELGGLYKEVTQAFALGNRHRKSGKLPYFSLLFWLAETENGVVYIDDLVNSHPTYRISLNQICEKGHIISLLKKEPKLEKYFFYNKQAKMLAIDDPKLLFYLRNLDWEIFKKGIGIHLSSTDNVQYDMALSFAGENRDIAKLLFQKLSDEEYVVFYDNDASPELLGSNVEEYLAPIYSSDAKFIIPLLNAQYANKVWTVFESKNYRAKWDENMVLPMLIDDYTPSPSDKLYGKGYFRLDSKKDIDAQLNEFVEQIKKKLG